GQPPIEKGGNVRGSVRVLEGKGVHFPVRRDIEASFGAHYCYKMMQTAHRAAVPGKDRLSGERVESMQHVVAFGAHDPDDRVGRAIRRGHDGSASTTEARAPGNAHR